MKRVLLSGLLLLLGAAPATFAQGAKDVIINELLVKNRNNYQDDYGHRVSWIELRNAGHSKIDLASCYLVLETNGKNFSYRIPKGDTRTTLAPGGSVVFFCEGSETKGTFHTNFTLTGETSDPATLPGYTPDSVDTQLPNQLVTLSFLDANGRDTIDKVTYNLADQKADISIGRTFAADGSQDVVFTALTSTTPNATNDINPPMPKHEKMRQADPHGFTMTITAVAVVFSALILLYFAFWALGKIMIRIAKRNKQKAAGVSVAPTEKKKDDGAIVGAEIAAIGMALKMYQDEMHDIESHVLTINRVAKAYSPWSSKIYGLTQPLHK